MENKYKYQEAYAVRNNLIAKTYKINKDLAERFKEACDAEGISQAGKLQELMSDWIEKGEEKMKELKNNVDTELTFTDLKEAKDWYLPDTEEFSEMAEYAEEIEKSETLEELADVLNRYTDTFGDGRYHTVESI